MKFDPIDTVMIRAAGLQVSSGGIGKLPAVRNENRSSKFAFGFDHKITQDGLNALFRLEICIQKGAMTGCQSLQQYRQEVLKSKQYGLRGGDLLLNGALSAGAWSWGDRSG